MTEQQKQVLTAIAGFMLSAAYKIDQIEKTTKCINLETENALNLIALGTTSSVRDIKVGGEWKYKFTPQVSLTDQTLIKIRNSGLEKALEFVTSHDVVDMNCFKEADGGMTIKFIYRKSK